MNKKNKIEDFKKKIEAAETEEEKNQIQEEVNKLNEVIPEVEYPKKVDSDNVLHLIVTGPPKSGKTHVAGNIASLHKRAHVKVDEIIDWVLNQPSETANKIKAYLD